MLKIFQFQNFQFQNFSGGYRGKFIVGILGG